MRLDNMKISAKILLVITVMAVVVIGAGGFAAMQMKAIDNSYSDVINRMSWSTTQIARLNRMFMQYDRDAFALDIKLSDENSARLTAEFAESQKSIESLLLTIGQKVPEYGDEVAVVGKAVQTAFAACATPIKQANFASTPDDVVKAGARLKSECGPPFNAAEDILKRTGASFDAHAQKASDDLSDKTHRTIFVTLGGIAAGLVLGTAFAVLLSRHSIVSPLSRLDETMRRLADNDLAAVVEGTARMDEVGDMARTVEVFKRNAIDKKRLEAEHAEQTRLAEEEHKREMHRMADAFEASVMGVVKTVSSSATEMQATAQSMAAAAQQANTQATTVATAAGQASANVQTVSSAAEELSAATGEISRQVTEAARISGVASAEAANTNSMVQSLSVAADKIGQVVKLINDIASQTNLLALNATIEAARAGDAGKGFAVVAGEVKNLANQTAQATEGISSQVTAVQEETRRAVAAIRNIAAVIDQMKQISSGIASAVEEQGAAMKEIARNVEEAAKGTQEVSANIGGVTQAAASTGAAAEQVSSSAADLATNSEVLRANVTHFLANVRAG